METNRFLSQKKTFLYCTKAVEGWGAEEVIFVLADKKFRKTFIHVVRERDDLSFYSNYR